VEGAYSLGRGATDLASATKSKKHPPRGQRGEEGKLSVSLSGGKREGREEKEREIS